MVPAKPDAQAGKQKVHGLLEIRVRIINTYTCMRVWLRRYRNLSMLIHTAPVNIFIGGYHLFIYFKEQMFFREQMCYMVGSKYIATAQKAQVHASSSTSSQKNQCWSEIGTEPTKTNI